MRRSLLSEVVSISVVIVGLLTMERWMPYWIAFWQFAFALAFKVTEMLI